MRDVRACEVAGGVTAPKGFVAGGRYCGIRKAKKDIALIVSDAPATVAAVFTLNKTVAACVTIDKQVLQTTDTCRAILVNSGNANACTGERGMHDALEMQALAAEKLGIEKDQVLVSSTGVIGQYLPMPNIREGIELLAESLAVDGSQDAAQAIMTTDTYAKETAVRLNIAGKAVTIGGIAKGSGMIAPNMATMLAFITTDAAIAKADLQPLFARMVDRSFNRISVDGDMSTNDMAIMLANGMSGAKPIVAGTPEFAQFAEGLEYVVVKLAKMIARDGEGATKLVEVVVQGAQSEGEALMAARSVANSNLVKTAIHGADANWGRILAAVGYSGIDFKPENVQLAINDLPILGRNYDIVLDEVAAKKAFEQENITLTVDLNQGQQRASFWTCDLSKEYVHINASYRS